MHGRFRGDEFLVHRPNFVPFHSVHVFRRALRQNKLFQRFDAHASSNDALDGGKPRVGPISRVFVIDEPLQLSFTQRRIREVHSRIIPQVHFALSLCLLNKLVLFFSVFILGRSQRVRDAFNGVHKRTREIVRRIHLVFIPCSMMRGFDVTSKAHRISHAPVIRLHVNFNAHATLYADGRTFLHLLPKFHIFLHRLCATRRFSLAHALFAHFVHWRCIHV